ncbi:MAG: helix-turn-helix transcriptional regulator [Gemmatimonadota bacterium]
MEEWLNERGLLDGLAGSGGGSASGREARWKVQTLRRIPPAGGRDLVIGGSQPLFLPQVGRRTLTVALPFYRITIRAPKPPPRGYRRKPRTLGERLRKRRINLGRLQRHVAQRLGVSPDTVKNWEAGRTEPQIRYVPRILDFLGSFTLPDAESASDFSAWLTLARRLRGLTQRDFAGRLGVDESTISGWEHGEHRPSKRNRLRIDAFLRARGERPATRLCDTNRIGTAPACSTWRANMERS